MDEMFENWGEVKAALLEGLDKSKAKIVGTLLENQKNHVLMENATSGAVQAHDVAGFRKILIPMIRRVIPGTIATEIVGVQPMQGPVGLVYTMRYRYAEAMSTGGLGLDINAGDEAFGNAKPMERFYSGDTVPGAELDGGQSPGASGFGAPSPTGIVGDATGQGWASSLDASAVGPAGAAGSLHGGSGSHIEGSGGRKMTLEVISQAVEARSRKLQAGWTLEAMQDLHSQHGLDLEDEMTKALSAEIVQEIDNEVINDLIALAGTVQTFDYAAMPADLKPTFIGDKFANVGIAINYICNEIARKTRRGPGNFIVCSPMFVSILQSAAKSQFAPAVQGSFKGPNNTMLVGTLNGTIKVYSYLWNQAQPGAGLNDRVLIGYKGGNGETDVGYFYCPYIPLMSSGTVVNPVTFQPVISLMTRYGKATFVNNQTSLGNSADYYGKLNIQNIQFV